MFRQPIDRARAVTIDDHLKVGQCFLALGVHGSVLAVYVPAHIDEAADLPDDKFHQLGAQDIASLVVASDDDFLFLDFGKGWIADDQLARLWVDSGC